jgi:hypothetical protein
MKSDSAAATIMFEQNYPNTFNPVTTINFFLLRREHVTLKIFNMRDEELITLVSGLEGSGKSCNTV